MEQSSSKKWYIIGGVIIIALALWYIYGRGSAPALDTQAGIAGGTQEAPLTGGDTTADISADLSQTADTSAALDADAAAVGQAVQEL